MKITSVKLWRYNKPGAVKMFVDIILDDVLIIRGLAIVERKDGDHYVSMPSKILKDGTRQEITNPIDKKFHAYLEDEILDAYENYLNMKES